MLFPLTRPIGWRGFLKGGKILKLGRGPQRNGHETTITTKTTHIGAYTTRHNETPVVPAHSSRLHGLAPLRQKCFQTPTHFTIFPIVREVYGRCSEVCLPSTSRPSIPRSVLPTLRATKPPFRSRLLRTRLTIDPFLQSRTGSLPRLGLTLSTRGGGCFQEGDEEMG